MYSSSGPFEHVFGAFQDAEWGSLARSFHSGGTGALFGLFLVHVGKALALTLVYDSASLV